MVEKAFWKDERVVSGTLGNIAAECRRVGINPPATLVVGEVVRSREKLLLIERDLHRSETGERIPALLKSG